MSRGWESKDVESQQDQREADRRARAVAAAEPPSQTQLQRESLQSTRARVAADLERARHPRHRAQLEAALAHLDAELAKLK